MTIIRVRFTPNGVPTPGRIMFQLRHDTDLRPLVSGRDILNGKAEWEDVPVEGREIDVRPSEAGFHYVVRAEPQGHGQTNGTFLVPPNGPVDFAELVRYDPKAGMAYEPDPDWWAHLAGVEVGFEAVQADVYAAKTEAQASAASASQAASTAATDTSAALTAVVASEADRATTSANQADTIKAELEAIFLGGTEGVNDAAVSTYVGTDGTLTDDTLKSRFSLRNSLDARLHGLVAGDGNDQAPALNAAADAARSAGVPLLIPAGSYNIDSTVNLRYLNVRSEGTITVRHTNAIGVIVGHTSVQRPQLTVQLREVVHAGYNLAQLGTAHPAIQVIGLKGSELNVGRTSHLEFYAASGVSTDDSTAYNTITLGRVNELNIRSDGPTGWINENLFLGGSFSRINMSGAYGHNNNKFVKPAIEGPVSYGCRVRLNESKSNSFEDVRLEGEVSLEFLGTASNNHMTLLWRNHADTIGTAFPVIDETGQNFVHTRMQQSNSVHTIMRIDADTQISSTKSEIRGMTSFPTSTGFKSLQIGSGTSFLAEFTIPIKDTVPADATRNQTLYPLSRLSTFSLHSDTVMIRAIVTGYTANGTQVLPSNTPFISTWGPISERANDYTVSTAVSSMPFRVTHPSIEYLKFVIWTTAAHTFKHITLSTFLPVGHHQGIVEQAQRAAHNRAAA